MFRVREALDNVAHRTAGVVVRQRLSGARRIGAFNAVYGVAVKQLAKPRARIIQDLLYAEKVPRNVNPICTFDISGQDEGVCQH